ncbi:MAG: M23 family metallopeptidase [Oscillospiraceae bacterium]|jgi:murein DD-endopeptidase MepM/ murein hydrolase activator NlpD|nr:M23 family metallopeptidase [Oscillospiraceae bacterium]
MAAGRDYYRERSRARGRAEPGGDFVATALTVQIILCVLLLAAFFALKSTDKEGFPRIKSEFERLVGTEAGGFSAYLSELGRVGEGLLDKAKGLMTGFAGGSSSAPEASSPEASTDYEEPSSSTPPPAEPASGQADAVPVPGYDYLDAQGAAQGDIQVRLSAGAEGAPEGCSYAAVALNAPVRSPVFGLITSPFAWREHPLSAREDFHTGIDIASAEGSRILAALPGEVSEVGENDIYGKYIILRHATNLETFYGHCSEIIAKEGMSVNQGERIAKVGMTGTATGFHLHFGVMVEGLFVDPYWILKDNIVVAED